MDKKVYNNEISLQDDKTETMVITLPTGYFKDVSNLRNVVEATPTEQLQETLNDDDLIALEIATSGLNAVAPKGFFAESVKDNWTQNIKFKDKEIKLKELAIRQDALKGVLSGKKALVKLNSFLGLSNDITIPLFHSGFKITLGNLYEKDIVNLTYKLAKRKFELGKNTYGMVFSNDNVIYTELILEFVLNHMVNTTLQIPDSEEIRDYILTPDIHIIALSVLRSIEPNGAPITRACKNAIVIDDEIKPKCNFVLSAKLDLEEIVYVDSDNMSDKHKETMLKSVPNSVTMDEMKEYQKTLSVNIATNVSIPVNDTNFITISLKTPSLEKHIAAGKKWISDIEESVEAQLNDINEDSDIMKLKLTEEIIKATILNKYLHYVDKITIDEAIVEDENSIYELLNSLVSAKSVYKELSEKFVKHIESSVIYVIGIPQYSCPTCKEAEDELPDNFREVIPLNVYHSFFEICTLKTTEMKNDQIL